MAAKVIWYTQGQTVNLKEHHMPKTKPLTFMSFYNMGVALAPKIAKDTGHRISTKQKKKPEAMMVSLTVGIDFHRVRNTSVRFVRLGQRNRHVDFSRQMTKRYCYIETNGNLKVTGRNAIEKAAKSLKIA